MNLLGFTAVLGLLVGVWAQIDVLKPPCDSLVAEEVGEVAQDYLNAHHKSGFKHRLNRIEDIKVFTKPDGDNTYKIEIDLLETDCHVLDPTPVANCTVRPKALTAIEGDCDVVLQKVGGALTVTAFKCKTEESTEDMCLGCPTLLPLNHTMALDFVSTSLGTFNNRTANISYVVQEVGRMSSQIVAGGPIYLAEYVIVEANCTDDPCVPLNDVMASRGICTAKGLNSLHTVDCKMFPTLMPFVDTNSTSAADPAIPPVVHATYKHGRKHHLLTAFHNPHLSGYLSAESAESAEVVPVVPVVLDIAPAAADPVPTAADPVPAAADPVPAAADPASDASDASDASEEPSSKDLGGLKFKREAPAQLVSAPADAPAASAGPIAAMPVCPGKVKFF